MKRGALFLLLSLIAVPLQAATNVPAGTISTSQTWTLAGSPYLLQGEVSVRGSSNPVLTIEAGVEVRGVDQNARLLVNSGNRGTLLVNGAAANRVRFTSNGTQAKGAWGGLYFGNAPNATPSRLNYAVVEYAGSTAASRGGITTLAESLRMDVAIIRENAFAGILINPPGGNAILSINGSDITANGGPGINAISGTSLVVTTTKFTGNAGYAVTMPAAMRFSSRGGNLAVGNTTNAVELRAGSITTDTTWPDHGIEFPFAVSGTIHVHALNANAPAPVLTIEAGVTVLFNAGAELSCNQSGRGVLRAMGKAGSPIVFTSNGTLTPGAWKGVLLGWEDAPPSELSHVHVRYGGATSSRGGITVTGRSPVLDQVYVEQNQYAGILVTGGAPSITSSTMSANNGPGIYASGGTLSLTGNTFTNNLGYAASLAATVPLVSASGNSATGNGTGGNDQNAIEYRSGAVPVDMTWPSSPLPYVVTGVIAVEGPAGPVLTIGPGNEIRFNSGASLIIHEGQLGALQANGTAGSPIRFTSNGPPTPGFWGGIQFGASASGPPSRISHATIEYAGNTWRGAIYVRSQSPELDHLVLRENKNAILTAHDTGTPRISNSQFLGNLGGIGTGGSAKVHATLNYWSSADGPCVTSCTATQQSVTSSVSYAPWLVAPPVEPLYLTAATHKNPTFNPLIGTQSFVEYSTSMSAQVTISIRNAAGQLVRTLLHSESPGTIFWNGKDESGATQPNGTYKYDIQTTAPSQPPATVARGFAVIDNSRTLTLSGPTVTQLFFSPNGDAIQDSTTVSAVSNFDDTAWTLSVLNASNNVVRTQTGAGLTFAFTWNGRDDTAGMQPDGVYKLRVEASVGAAPAGASLTQDGTTTLDNAPPVAVFTSPAAGVISNVYAAGNVTTLTPSGTASDLNLKQWEVHYSAGANPNPNSWHPLEWANQSVTNGALLVANHELHDGPWNTAGLSGVQSLRLTVLDKAGNRSESRVSPLDFQHFSANQNNVYQFNAVAGGTLKYTSKIPTLPFRATESIVIKNLQGAVVRQLLPPTVRIPGTHDDFFNGRNDAGELLPDGPYFYVATVTSGGHTLVWDQSNVIHWGQHAHVSGLNVQPYDPFNNKPLTVQYTFLQPARVTVGTSTINAPFIGNCDQPSDTFFCAADKIWQEAGTHTFTWWGIDHTGSYRTIRNIGIVSTVNEANPFPENAAILFGSKPKLENVKVFPPVFGPEVGTPQRIEFDLTTLKSAPAEVKVELVNLTTKSTLRTLVEKQPPGHGVIEWDGRADSGLYVAPGRYNVIVTVTDAIGNVVRSGILTEIQY